MHGFTSNSTVAWQVKRGPTATGSFNLPNGAVTPRISSPSDRNQMGRACSLQLQEKTSNRGCHEAVAMRDFWDWWFQLGALDIPKFQSIVDYLSICLSIYLSFQGSFQVLGCLGHPGNRSSKLNGFPCSLQQDLGCWDGVSRWKHEIFRGFICHLGNPQTWRNVEFEWFWCSKWLHLWIIKGDWDAPPCNVKRIQRQLSGMHRNAMGPLYPYFIVKQHTNHTVSDGQKLRQLANHQSFSKMIVARLKSPPQIPTNTMDIVENLHTSPFFHQKIVLQISKVYFIMP